MIEVKDLPAPPDNIRVRRALLSAYDKTGLVRFARELALGGVALVSSGGTAKALRAAGLAVEDVSDVTGFPEILGGRVKTLHPRIHGGLLFRRGDPDDEAELDTHGIQAIDLVVVNLYPFSETVAHPEVTDSAAAENIDIGGPAMARAAAKNFAHVAVVTSPQAYQAVLDELATNDMQLSLATRRRLAGATFEHTAGYDRAIANYLSHQTDAPNGAMPDTLTLALPRALALRYGENPHQKAAVYGKTDHLFEKLHGRALSYNNFLDLSAALALIDEFPDKDPTVAILKHTNPCGVSTGDTLEVAYHRAFATDRQSPFGGIVIVNKALDLGTAKAINAVFTEIIIAPDFEEGVLEFLMRKKNRRLVRQKARACMDQGLDARAVLGGFLAQERDIAGKNGAVERAHYTTVTKREPSPQEWQDLTFAWRVVKHVKSNAIVYARDRSTVGIGAGQMSRIDASDIAVLKGQKSGLDFTGSVIASDAFFPFADGLMAAADSGACAAIQPGGSVRDEEVIRAADERGMAMVFTGRRHFRH